MTSCAELGFFSNKLLMQLQLQLVGNVQLCPGSSWLAMTSCTPRQFPALRLDNN